MLLVMQNFLLKFHSLPFNILKFGFPKSFGQRSCGSLMKFLKMTNGRPTFLCIEGAMFRVAEEASINPEHVQQHLCLERNFRLWQTKNLSLFKTMQYFF